MNTEFMVYPGCKNQETYQGFLDIIKNHLSDFISSTGVNTLKYFIVSDDNNYIQTVEEYGNQLRINTSVTVGEYTGYGKTLNGYTAEGEYIQIIIIRAIALEYYFYDICLIYNLYTDSLPQCNKVDYKGIKTIYHEIGHAWNNQNFKRYNISESNKIQYNLYYELDEYLFQSSISLSHEYYAHLFMYERIKTINISLSIDDEAKTLLDCISTYNKKDKIENIADRISMILYHYFHLFAYCHVHIEHNDYLYSKMQEVGDYFSYFERLDKAILDLNDKYIVHMKKDDFRPIANIFGELIEFEKSKYIC